MKTHAQAARVLLVDDHPAVLRQVTQLLLGEFQVVATLESGEGLSTAVELHRPDVIVLDVTLPGVNGIELVARFKRAGNDCKFVFLTMHDDLDYAQAALAAGAIGYVLKAQLAADLIPAIRSALTGHRFVSPSSQLKELME